jgi:hypothetical protein
MRSLWTYSKALTTRWRFLHVVQYPGMLRKCLIWVASRLLQCSRCTHLSLQWAMPHVLLGPSRKTPHLCWWMDITKCHLLCWTHCALGWWGSNTINHPWFCEVHFVYIISAVRSLTQLICRASKGHMGTYLATWISECLHDYGIQDMVNVNPKSCKPYKTDTVVMWTCRFLLSQQTICQITTHLSMNWGTSFEGFQGSLMCVCGALHMFSTLVVKVGVVLFISILQVHPFAV